MNKPYHFWMTCVSCFLFAIPGTAHSQDSGKKITAYVNPFIGTGAVSGSSLSGNNYPGATVPFGMVQLSPDTKDSPDWGAASGYDYNDKTIAGFSHTHLSGTGVAEMFDVLLMPTTGRITTVAGIASTIHQTFRQPRYRLNGYG